MAEWIVRGRVLGAESKRPAGGLRVVAEDSDVLFDDHLGEAITGTDGSFEIRYDEAAFTELGETNPDIYLEIHGPAGLILSTREFTRWNAGQDEVFELFVPESAVRDLTTGPSETT